MTTGYILILAVLILGGVIATVGDRIGMRVGKARLTLFNLRPRQTATVISVLTGSVVSATTLALLFAVSDQLRTGVFELGTLQEDLKQARQSLRATQSAKSGVEEELATSVRDQLKARQRLRNINNSLQTVVERQAVTQAKLNQTQQQLRSVSGQAQNLRSDISSLQSERQNLLAQQATVRAQIAERDREINQRDQEISQRDREIAQRNQAIAQRETRLQKLQDQQAYLEQQIEQLDREFLGLRQGSVAIGRNEPLVARAVEVNDPQQALAVVTRLLQEANWFALQQINPSAEMPDQQIIRIASNDVEQLAERISDGQEYIVRFLSAANYVVGEPCVIERGEPCLEVFTDAVINRQIYQPGEQLAATAIEADNPSDRELLSRLQLLITATQFRSSQDGVIDGASSDCRRPLRRSRSVFGT
ncbi:MAG: DUF3084 domain-containing protein, partial [Leptolyngbyaceae cyanobacterium RM1_1_2]|nr:DUF3084 domain-containing protein [Leptolyngbyaceae cyanobacterium RM1_1_2]